MESLSHVIDTAENIAKNVISTIKSDAKYEIDTIKEELFHKKPAKNVDDDDDDKVFIDEAAAGASNLRDSSDLPYFEGKLYDQNNPDYLKRVYQYAYSSQDKNQLKPKFVLYPANDNDVIKAVNYAKEKNIAIAVRTGGHQYGGASSTNGENFQLDMSQTYHEFEVNSDRTLVKTGISHALLAFNEKMAKNRIFMPTGQCRHVHVGGHVQTGGYGQLGRAFGLFGDCVQKLRIIIDSPNGAIAREVSRDATEKSDQDLFFAVLGGSPGNFGVLTHLWIRPFRDEDYPDCRGLKVVYRWDKEKMQKFLDVMVDMECDPDFPRNFDLCISVLSNTGLILPYMFLGLNEDAEAKKIQEDWGKDGQPIWPNTIVIYAQYVKLPGQAEPDHKAWFKKLTDIGGNPLFGKRIGMPLSPDSTNVMSKIIPNWLFSNYREYLLPYVKRCYTTNWTQQLRDNKWSEWMSERIDKINSKWFGTKYLAVQIQPFGGKNSMYYQNAQDGKTSYSWRDDTTIVAVYDLFYDKKGLPFPTTKDDAEKWQAETDFEAIGGNTPKFCDTDRRMLWGSHGSHDLPQTHQCYYEPGKYDALLKIKKEVDPKLIFSPNEFCVGGAHPAAKRANTWLQVKLKGAKAINATSLAVASLIGAGDVLDGANVVEVEPEIDEAEMVKEVLEFTKVHYAESDQQEHIHSLDENIHNINKDVTSMQQQAVLAKNADPAKVVA